jgi:hypothetical protein
LHGPKPEEKKMSLLSLVCRGKYLPLNYEDIAELNQPNPIVWGAEGDLEDHGDL